MYDNPSEDVLFLLLEDVQAGESSWVIVERPEDRSGWTYAQVLRLADGRHVVEHRAGSADRHYTATVDGYREAHEVLNAWAFDLPGWREIVWSRLVL